MAVEMTEPRYPEHERTRTQHLTEGLVGPHVRLYRTNVVFHNAIDTLAAMLPAMVEGLMADAEKREVERQRLMEQIMNAPIVLNLPDEWRDVEL